MALRFEVWQDGKAKRWKWRLVSNGRVLVISGLWYTRKHRATHAMYHLLQLLTRASARTIPVHFLTGKVVEPKKIPTTRRNTKPKPEPTLGNVLLSLPHDDETY